MSRINSNYNHHMKWGKLLRSRRAALDHGGGGRTIGPYADSLPLSSQFQGGGGGGGSGGGSGAG